MQQILAYETDLLEFDDIFDDNKAIEEKVRELKSHARETISQIDKMGGAINSIEFMKTELVKANTKRLKSIERGDTIIVGVNKFINESEKEYETSTALAFGMTGRLPIEGINNLVGNIEANMSLRNSYSSLVMGVSLPIE